MIGNDIVDLAEAKLKSNWQRPRFLEKLFTLVEQQLIKNSEDQFLMVWRLWSMKEAAYKLYTQLNPSRFYNPKAFECNIEDTTGKLSYKGFTCYIQTKITSNYILSEARLQENRMTSEIILFNSMDSKHQSKNLKLSLLNRLSKTYNISTSKLKLSKSNFGIPTVHINSEIINVSLTHHGNYGAVAFSKT